MIFARLCLLNCLVAAPLAAAADTAVDDTPVEAAVAAPALSAQISLTIVRPALDAEGAPVLDADGLPTFTFIPAEETTILPGDEIRYLVDVENAGADATNLELAFDLPAQAALLPATISSDPAATFAVGDGATLETRTPVFDETGAVSEAFESFEDGSQVHLFATISDLPSGETGVITYNMTIR